MTRGEKNMHKGLLFDLDGVIVDTARYHYLAWKELAQELGIPFTREDNERLKGVSRNRSFEIILEIGNRQMEEAQKEYYCTRKNGIYLEYLQTLSEKDILPGVQEFLEAARAKGYRTALGSASKNAVFILEKLKLSESFDAVIDGNKVSKAKPDPEVSKAKPDPEVFLNGAAALGLAGCDCIVFEDAAAGIKAAHAGGMRAVGIGKPEILSEADYVIRGFEKITIEEIEQEIM